MSCSEIHHALVSKLTHKRDVLVKTGFQAGDFLEGAYIEPHPTAKREGEEYRLDFSLQQVCNVLKENLENFSRCQSVHKV